MSKKKKKKLPTDGIDRVLWQRKPQTQVISNGKGYKRNKNWKKEAGL